MCHPEDLIFVQGSDFQTIFFELAFNSWKLTQKEDFQIHFSCASESSDARGKSEQFRISPENECSDDLLSILWFLLLLSDMNSILVLNRLVDMNIARYSWRLVNGNNECVSVQWKHLKVNSSMKWKGRSKNRIKKVELLQKPEGKKLGFHLD